MTAPGWGRRSLAEALAAAGVARGDVVFSHSNVGLLGVPEGPRTAEAVCRAVLEAFQDALGPEGTLVVPTFSYSFCRAQPFDPARTPSTCGMFTEFLRTCPGAARSLDPIFSVAALGARARELTDGVGEECFGEASVWRRLFDLDGLVCNVNLDAGSTFLHWVERRANVPYRADRLFEGELVEGDRSRRARAIYFSRDLADPGAVPRFEAFHRLAVERGACATARIGRGGLVALRARRAHDLLVEALRERPRILTAAGA